MNMALWNISSIICGSNNWRNAHLIWVPLTFCLNRNSVSTHCLHSFYWSDVNRTRSSLGKPQIALFYQWKCSWEMESFIHDIGAKRNPRLRPLSFKCTLQVALRTCGSMVEVEVVTLGLMSEYLLSSGPL